jgi:hypothetical protein
MKRLVCVLLALTLVCGISFAKAPSRLAATHVDLAQTESNPVNVVLGTPSDVRNPLDAPYCFMYPSQPVYGGWSISGWTPGDIIKEYFDPEDPACFGTWGGSVSCGLNPYPFRIDTFRLRIYSADTTSAPSKRFYFTVDIECPLISGDKCSGPDPLRAPLWSGSFYYDMPKAAPGGTVLVQFAIPINPPNFLCVNSGFFVGYTFNSYEGDNSAAMVPRIVLYDEGCAGDMNYCRQWYGYGCGFGDIASWLWPCGDPDPGYITSGKLAGWWVRGEAQANCTPVACTNYDVDMGDLTPNYPTLVNNPGHMLTGIAWLGQGITGEPVPVFNGDNPTDDGVWVTNYLDGITSVPLSTCPSQWWNPCDFAHLDVLVTAGPNYAWYEGCGGHLYLNAWKDGNLDGDFCDALCDGGGAPEWFIQNAPVVPGMNPFDVVDPGLVNMGHYYAGVFRFRLTSSPVDQFGFGYGEPAACPGSYGLDWLGEVEDYFCPPDFQLAVNLSSFDAAPNGEAMSLTWVTASESHNDHFVIERDGIVLANVRTLGNDASGHTYHYADNNVVVGTVYNYKLVAVDETGARQELATKTVTMSPNSAAEVTAYALHQNYPNPFNPTTTITFDVLETGHTTLTVFNLMGEEVTTLVNGNMTKGSHTTNFNAANLPSGVYVARLTVNGFSADIKMLLMK